jgi:hypothetical protein
MLFDQLICQVYLFSTLPKCFSFSGEILLFFNKEIGNTLEFFSSSEIRLILILIIFFQVKFHQIFDMEKMKKKTLLQLFPPSP